MFLPSMPREAAKKIKVLVPLNELRLMVSLMAVVTFFRWKSSFSLKGRPFTLPPVLMARPLK